MQKIINAGESFQVINSHFAAQLPSDCTMSMSLDGTNFSDYEEEVKAGVLQVANIAPDTYVKFSAGNNIIVNY